jgi:hypothetical protein
VPSRRAVAVALALVLALGPLTGCAGSPAPAAAPASPTRSGAPAEVAPPPLGADFDYQLGGAAEPADGVRVVARDSTDAPAPGLYGICYVNGFQTQPGEGDDWLAEAPGLVLHDGDEPFVDPGWPDEYLLDTTTPEKRAGILERVGPVIAGCATSGFQAVEIDNLDSWTRSDGLLTEEGSIALAAAYADLAHESGLAIAQKNGAGRSAALRDAVGFDFAVTEECARYDECADYLEAYDGLVFDIEYAEPRDAEVDAFAERCGADDVPASMILRDVDLTTPGGDGYLRATCG